MIKTGEFKKNRLLALERDNYHCVKCGIDNAKSKEKYHQVLTVDHINGNGVYDSKSEQPNHGLDNLQTLCLGCHGLKSQPRKHTEAKERPFTSRECHKCGVVKSYPENFPINHFYNGFIYRRAICNDCRRIEYRKWGKTPKANRKDRDYGR